MGKNTSGRLKNEALFKAVQPHREPDPLGSPGGPDDGGVFRIGSPSQDVLHALACQGARQMIAQALEEEVRDYLERHAEQRDAQGHRLVVRNGHKDPRTILTGVGAVEVCQPRVNDRRVDEQGQRVRFESKLLPPYLRRARSIDELVPWLYLKGISTGDMSEALAARRASAISLADDQRRSGSFSSARMMIEPSAGGNSDATVAMSVGAWVI